MRWMRCKQVVHSCNHLIRRHATPSPQGEGINIRTDFLNKTHNKKLTSNSQFLRKNMTKEERHLWYDFLKDLPVTFHRQKVFNNYIVDFYCASAKIVIELDGSQHYFEDGIKKDKARDNYLISLGLTVLRYSNYDVNNAFESVCQDIFNNLVQKEVIPSSSPRGEGVTAVTDEVL